ncbi:MAG: hypothetical protein ACD_10C00771G0001 [uncultured bacterium]|nr:MAG: hypothetical protein ACD_10C00771G0001 [uncultured bacterium]
MPICSRIKTRLNEIGPGAQRLSHDTTIIEGLQLLDEENCNQREKAHGGPEIAGIGLFLY